MRKNMSKIGQFHLVLKFRGQTTSARKLRPCEVLVIIRRGLFKRRVHAYSHEPTDAWSLFRHEESGYVSLLVDRLTRKLQGCECKMPVVFWCSEAPEELGSRVQPICVGFLVEV